jgi:SAM-dependent methyltransferase
MRQQIRSWGGLLLVVLVTGCAGKPGPARTAPPPESAQAQEEVAPPTVSAASKEEAAPPRGPDVVYVPTPERVVDEMLRMAKVGKQDVLYDLGSGDGRIPIRAAQQFGIRAVGIDIDPERIAEARQNAKEAKVTHLVEFREEDLFESDFSEATVVTLYLLPELNVRLRPRLWAELPPGTRIVSHAFDMGDWKPLEEKEVDGSDIFLWIVPERGQAR